MAPPEHDAPVLRPLHIAADHPAYDGHFPGMPVLPGAVLLDEALRLLATDLGLDLTAWQLTAAKFPHGVRPGEEITLEHSAIAGGVVRFCVRSSGRTALSGTLSRMSGGGLDDG